MARSIAWLGALARFLFQTLEAARWLPRAGRRAAIIETIQNLSRSAEILEHFAEQISRRPMRMLWGVTPPPPERDSTQEDSTDQEQ